MGTVRARQAAVVKVNGSPIGVAEGQAFDEDSDVVRQHGWLFELPVEQATAAPGQRRNVRRQP